MESTKHLANIQIYFSLTFNHIFVAVVLLHSVTIFVFLLIVRKTINQFYREKEDESENEKERERERGMGRERKRD